METNLILILKEKNQI